MKKLRFVADLKDRRGLPSVEWKREDISNVRMI